MPFKGPPPPPPVLRSPRAKSTPPTTTTVFIGVDSNKRPIKTAYVGAGMTSAQSRFPRYPNYLPELKAKRVGTARPSFQETLNARLENQRQAEEAVLNTLVIQKARRIASMGPEIRPPPYRPHRIRDLRPLVIDSLPGTLRKSSSQVQSLFRVSPEGFSDSGSRVVQVPYLGRTHLTPPRPRSLPSQAASSDTDSDVSEYLKRRARQHQR